MTATVHSQPLRGFVEREPQLALRLLIGERGGCPRRVVQALSDVVAQTHSPERAKALQHNIDVVVRVATSLQWANARDRRRARTEEAVEILRVLLTAGAPSSA